MAGSGAGSTSACRTGAYALLQRWVSQRTGTVRELAAETATLRSLKSRSNGPGRACRPTAQPRSADMLYMSFATTLREANSFFWATDWWRAWEANRQTRRSALRQEARTKNGVLPNANRHGVP